MKEIKFRGRSVETGELVYGDLVHHSNYPYIYIPEGSDYEVEQESVAQLVGYDRNGREVYEGDLIIDNKGFEYKAVLFSRAKDCFGNIHFDVNDFKLKEAHDD